MLNRIEIVGFKSIREMNLELRPINVMIGANGAGKSNLVSFFKLLNYLTSGSLQRYIGESGGAESLLYFGAKTTSQLSAYLHFDTPTGKNAYFLRLVSAAQDTLIFADEAVSFSRYGKPDAGLYSLGAGHKETLLKDISNGLQKTNQINIKTVTTIKGIMDRWRVYHFHDTSAQANIKKLAYVNDNSYLRADAGNLAAFLYFLRQNRNEYYQRIVATIRLAIPFFDEFILIPSPHNGNYIILNWRETGSPPDTVFGPHQLSDGTLRLMALVTLLLQPESILLRENNQFLSG